MDLLLSWAVFPAVLALATVGCGLAFEALVGTRLQGGLVPGCGFAVMIVVGQFLTLTDATAELMTPAIVTLSVLGFGLAMLTGRLRRPPLPMLVAAGAVFAIYAAPFVLSGAPTLAGFIRLDDTATWLTFTDHLVEHGRDLGGLQSSTFEAVLAVNIGDGYPVGVFLPLGFASQLLGIDPAWVIQTYMAFMAVLFALAAWTIVAPLVRRPWSRAAVVIVASQPALLFGYYLWGGIKEVAAAAMIATVAALAAHLLAKPNDTGRAIALALGAGAVLGILSGGGGLWLAPIIVVALIVVARALSPARLARQACVFIVTLAFLAIPVILPGGLLPPTSSPLSDAEAKGNLIEPLEPAQALGVWPTGDFRLDPVNVGLTYLVCALALALVVAGGWWALRRGATAALLLLGGGLAGGLTLIVVGSPWVEGKALATASPMLLLMACLGTVAVAAVTKPRIGLAAGAVLAAGVLWSNALAYSEVNLAPHDQFEELESVGQMVAGEGPTLMTEYSPYGVRHFLRDGDPEAVSELRRRTIPTLNGGQVEKGYSADIDELQAQGVHVYRSLVLRRSPTASRPPSAYELVWSGAFYELWQRPEGVEVPNRLPLGSENTPLAEPQCADVTALAQGGSDLVAARRTAPVVGGPAAVIGDFSSDLQVPVAGTYEVWLEGSVRPSVEIAVDGQPVGSVRHQLNNEGSLISFGRVDLEPGSRLVEVDFGGFDLHPGSAGTGQPVGPLVLTLATAADSTLTQVEASDARSLCGREWDWIETAD